MGIIENFMGSLNYPERSDESILRQNRRFNLEAKPEPLQMSDSEILDWIGERCEQVCYSQPESAFLRGWTLFVPELPNAVKGYTLRQAVQQAAAELNAVNE